MTHTPQLDKQAAQEKFAHIWMNAFARFHHVKDLATWQFDRSHLVDFLRSKLSSGMPTWKRLNIIDGVIWYQEVVRKQRIDFLYDMRGILQRRAVDEQLGTSPDSPADIEAVVGKINPREPDVIQALRRSMRVQGKAFNTKKAYVQKIRAFMAYLGLKNLADFETITGKDVESHLTDLAVDGDVAPSTQNQSFYALLREQWLFQGESRIRMNGSIHTKHLRARWNE